MPQQVLAFLDAEAVARYAADEFIRRARGAILDHGVFRVALAGGSTPRRTYELLAEPSRAKQVNWKAVQVFFGDERTVPPDHEDSNYGSARAALLSKIGVPDSRVHRMEGERKDPREAARAYEAAMAKAFNLVKGSGWPRFDLIMLGMGTDGHTASLFPGTAALRETEAWTVANDVPQKHTRRLTFTAPLLNAARCVMFVVAGPDKARRLAEVLEGPKDPERLPAQFVAPAAGDLLWLIDQAAASQLTRKSDPSPESRSPA